MEPGTASRLKERPSARLRDYLVMAGPLAVTHLLVFTLTDAANVHLRMARIPQGPTITLRVERYSCMKDLVNAGLRGTGKAPGGEYRTPPLLVLNNFQQPPGQPAKPQLKLLASMFQGLFPPIQVDKAALPSFRRVLLVSYHSESSLISVRHYIISVRPHGVSRRVRKILTTSGLGEGARSRSTQKARVNLSSAEDIADYLLRRRGESATPSEGGTSAAGTQYDSASESEMSEAESDTNAVELPEDYVGRGNKKGTRKAVRLIEVGPRMELRLIKITEGLVGSKKGEGETVFHEFVHKSKGEAAEQQKAHTERRKLREQRRKEQEANVARKAAATGKGKGKGKAKAEDGDDDDEDAVDLGDGELPEVEGLSDDEFAYEDRFARGTDRDDGDFDEDAEAGDVSEASDSGGESDESEDEGSKKRRRK